VALIWAVVPALIPRAASQREPREPRFLFLNDEDGKPEPAVRMAGRSVTGNLDAGVANGP
jgi:hypothetical protein